VDGPAKSENLLEDGKHPVVLPLFTVLPIGIPTGFRISLAHPQQSSFLLCGGFRSKEIDIDQPIVLLQKSQEF